MDKITIYKDQLNRMRSMNRYYHDQFLLDVRILFILNTIFVFFSFENDNAFKHQDYISADGKCLISLLREQHPKLPRQ